MTSATPLSLYQLRIVLCGISPFIWRRVLVRSETTLAHLHAILQILFAWSDEHLHRFHIKEYGSSGVQTRRVLLSDLQLHRGERFRYVYDFGAHWACDIRLEAIRPLAPRERGSTQYHGPGWVGPDRGTHRRADHPCADAPGPQPAEVAHHGRNVRGAVLVDGGDGSDGEEKRGGLAG
jgi:Plasmid pRiA4b ORF-3-like protein